MDTFKAIAKPQGMKFTPLFVEQIGDTDARFRRLENAVQNMKNDFDTVMPSMVRLVAIEKDMRDLVTQLQSLTDAAGPVVDSAPAASVEAIPIPDEDVAEGTGAAKGVTTPAAASATSSSSVTPEAAPQGVPPSGAASLSSPPAAFTTPPATIAPAVQAQPPEPVPLVNPPPAAVAPAQPAAPVPAAGTIRKVRIGDHMDKTRIVLDLSSKFDAPVTMANGGKQVVVDLPGMQMAGRQDWLADNSQIVSGWRFADGKLYIDLIYPATLKGQQILPPNGTPDYRLVIDIHSDDVHLR